MKTTHLTKFNLHWRSHTTPRAEIRDELTLINRYFQIRSSLRRRIILTVKLFFIKSLYQIVLSNFFNFVYLIRICIHSLCNSALIYRLKSDQVRSIKFIESKCQKSISKKTDNSSNLSWNHSSDHSFKHEFVHALKHAQWSNQNQNKNRHHSQWLNQILQNAISLEAFENNQ